MRSQRPGEDWSEADLDMLLLELPRAHIDESMRCHQAGCRLAALVMLAAAMESVLLGMVIAQEEGLRADGRWPPRPSTVHLRELAGLAKERGWLTDPATDQVVTVLNKARTMAAHPGAYVRGIRQASASADCVAPAPSVLQADLPTDAICAPVPVVSWLFAARESWQAAMNLCSAVLSVADGDGAADAALAAWAR
jgi:hypothetical protein